MARQALALNFGEIEVEAALHHATCPTGFLPWYSSEPQNSKLMWAVAARCDRLPFCYFDANSLQSSHTIGIKWRHVFMGDRPNTLIASSIISSVSHEGAARPNAPHSHTLDSQITAKSVS